MLKVHTEWKNGCDGSAGHLPQLPIYFTKERREPLTHSVSPWGPVQECKSLWGNKEMIQHIGVGKLFVSGHRWPAENLVSFC